MTDSRKTTGNAGWIEQISCAAETAFQMHRHAVRPIYGVGRKGHPAHIGSCFFARVRGQRYMVTAAHVINNAKSTSLLIPVSKRFVQIDGTFFHATTRSSEDHVDFAWAAVGDDFFDAPDSTSYIDETLLPVARADESRHVYMLVGFPRSKNKKANPTTRKIVPKIYHYFAGEKEIPELREKLVDAGSAHLLIDYRSRVKMLSGEAENATGLRGLSGGPVFDVGPINAAYSASSRSVFSARLAGIFIEHWDEYGVAVATKIELLVAEILAVDPAIGPSVRAVEV